MDDNAVLLDTNVLLSATARTRPLNENALRILNDWPNRGIRLCTSGQILREYMVVATRPPDVNGLGLRYPDAASNLEAFQARMRFLEENRAVFARFRQLTTEIDCSGKAFHDANVVATALTHGVTKIVTAETEHFQRFSKSLELLPLAEV